MAVARRGREQALGGAGQVGVATERGRAEGGGRRVQQAVGQAMGQQFQHFVGGLAIGQLLPRTLQQFGPGGLAEGAQLPQGRLVGAGLQGFDEARDLQVDDRLGFGGGLAAAAAVVFHRALKVVHGVQEGIVECERLFGIVDAVLANQPWLSGDRFGVGDIPLGCVVYGWLNMPIERQAHPHLERWYQQLTERPAYQKHVMIPLS